MESQWLTVQEAAKALGVSERTIWNRIKRGDYQTRDGDNGRREVCVELTESPETIPHPFQVLQDAADRQLQVSSVAVGLAEQGAKDARAELTTARRSARLAWSLTFLATLTIGGASWLVARQAGMVDVARAQARAAENHANDTGRHADGLASRLDQAQQQSGQLASRLEKAQAEASRAGGELTKALADALKNERRVADLQAKVAAAELQAWQDQADPFLDSLAASD